MPQVDAVKRNCIKVLPHTLVVHLKRFEFDYETMNRWKIKDRFAFPLRLDMHPYTVEGLAEADAVASGKVCTYTYVNICSRSREIRSICTRTLWRAWRRRLQRSPRCAATSINCAHKFWL